jgi:hypothetical protein
MNKLESTRDRNEPDTGVVDLVDTETSLGGSECR